MTIPEMRYPDAENLASVFNKNGVLYLFIGQSGSIALGFPGTTQDVDIFASKEKDNPVRILSSLQELGFHVSEDVSRQILSCKDFIQIRNDGPFALDIIFAPDGIPNFDSAADQAVVMAGLPVCHPDDIIRSKEASNRDKDRRTLPALKQFTKWIQDKWRRDGAPQRYRDFLASMASIK